MKASGYEAFALVEMVGFEVFYIGVEHEHFAVVGFGLFCHPVEKHLAYTFGAVRFGNNEVVDLQVFS